MNNIFDIINVPLGILMKTFYSIFNNYALAILFFAIVVKIILLPLGIKQQQGQIKMAKIKPKEQAIRGKYAGRTDSVTKQKEQNEVLDMYKAENYSPMSGCLPMLVQLPILFALYNIIRNPLTYISRLAPELLDNIKKFIFDNSEAYARIVQGLGKWNESGEYIRSVAKFENIQQIDIINIFNNTDWLAEIKSKIVGFPADFKNIDFGFLGQMLTSTPAQMGISLLLLIPVLNFAASFLQMRLQKIISAKTMAADAANNNSMKIMEYTMPLLIVWMSYSMNAALGLYWIFQSVLGIVQTIVLSKLYPIPQITEEEYELARQKYGTAKKKKKKTVVDDENGTEEIVEETAEETDKDDERYISKTIPKGINQNVRNNYQKTGKKYKINKRKK